MLFELKSIISCVVLVSVVTSIALFGGLPSLRKTPIGLAYRAIWIYIPRFVKQIDDNLTGGRIIKRSSAWASYLFNEKHPLILIIFASLMIGSECLFLPAAWQRLSFLHQCLTVIAITIPYVGLYFSATTDPGVITKENVTAVLGLYPFDHTLYFPQNMCRTCDLEKPARSKHCRVCKRCISRQDHHCPWINNCVGYGNQHHFLLLLVSTGMMLLYGAFLGHRLLHEAVQAAYMSRNAQVARILGRSAPPDTIWTSGTGGKVYFRALSWAIMDDRRIGTTFLLAVATVPLAWGFLLFHVYEIWAGMTTNESAKWSALAMDMADGLVFKGKMKHKVMTRRTGAMWPISSDQVILRTLNGRVPEKRKEFDLIPRDEWEPVWHLRDIVNLYDLGFSDNIVDSIRGAEAVK